MKKFLTLVSVLFLFGCGNSVSENQEKVANVELANSEISVIKNESKEILEENFSIKLDYPVFSDEGLNGFVEALFTDSRKAFEENAKSESNISIAWEFDGMVQKVSEDDSQISLLYTEYQFSGGAHGNTLFKTIVYDKKNRGVLSLRNFLPNTDLALKDFAKKVQSILMQEIEDADEDWIKDGAGADFENFSNFVLTENGTYRIYFPAYQVAPYVNGPQIVDIKK